MRFVKPAEGLNVRDPHTRQHLPREGRWVPDDAHWARLLTVGDVVEATPPAPASEGPAA